VEYRLGAVAEYVVERIHLLGEIVQRAAEDRSLPAQDLGPAFELDCDCVEHVGGVSEGVDPLRGDHLCDHLFDDAVAEPGLAREMVEERALGNPSALEDLLERGGLKPMEIDLLLADFE
jgi:hypothetical protein